MQSSSENHSKKAALSSDFSGSRLVFFDEGKSSSRLGDFMSAHSVIDSSSLYDFLLYGSILPPRSPLQGVAQLYPGETRHANASRLEYQEMQYDVHKKSIDKLVDEFEASLEAEVGRRSADTVLLSGGIDSAILLSYLPKGATCITWGGKGVQTDDVAYSKLSAAQFEAGEHHFEFADYDRDFALYKKAVQKLGIPILFNSAVPFLRMAERGRAEGVSRWFVGQNADTVFMAYPAPVLTKRLSMLNRAIPFNPLRILAGRKGYLFSTPSTVRILAYFKSLGVFPGPWISPPDAVFTEKEAILRSIPATTEEQRIIVLEELLTESRRNQICQNEIPALQGIESLCPYYSESFVKLALSVPEGIRSLKGYDKVVLRELARRRGVPEAVIYKKKTGLSYGLNAFMNEKRHLPVWDAMEQDADLNALVDIRAIRTRQQENYLTFIMLSSLHYWFEFVARPKGLALPKEVCS